MDKWEEDMKKFNDHFTEEMKKSKTLPKGLTLGKIFSIPVADNYAYYEVVRVNKRTVKIKCRKDLSPDGYMDMILGMGGSFDKKRIKTIVECQERTADLFQSCFENPDK